MKIDRTQKVMWFAHSEISDVIHNGSSPEAGHNVSGVWRPAKIILAPKDVYENSFDIKTCVLTLSTDTVTQLNNDRWIGKDGSGGKKVKIGKGEHTYQFIMDDVTASKMEIT
jgi:hypothetical protein